jgi:uncharacterized protein YjbI with pentapeptide repeats
MANEEHRALLREGVRNWNTWREENGNIRPDLSRVDFNGASLMRADLRGTDLGGADLREAALNWASLRGTDLGGAVADNA